MTILSALPTELKLCIADRLWTGDLFSFALTSKEHWVIFGELAIKEHRALREKYGAVTANENTEHVVWDLLHDVIQIPRIANYVRSLSLPSDRGVYYDSRIWNARDVTDDTIRPPSQQTELFIKAAEEDNLQSLLVDYMDEREERPYIANDDRATALAIENGSDDPIVALLMNRLPKLEKLSYEDWGDNAHLWFLIKKTALEYGSPQPNPGSAFRNLTSVHLQHWDTEMCIDWAYARYFICMPNLRKLSAHMMGGEGDQEFAELDQPNYEPRGKYSKLPRSNVKSLEFSYCNIAIELMAQILSGIEALEDFYYNGGGAVVSYTFFEGKGVLAGLKKYCVHSLERLHLDDESEEPHPDRTLPSVSLRDFQKLKHIRMSWSDLVPDEDELDNADKDGSGKDEPLTQGFFTEEEESSRYEYRLVDLLPASLEYLYLAGVPEDDTDKVIGMLEQKDEYLPNLKRIHVDDGRSMRDVIQHPGVRTAAAKAGVTWQDYEEYRVGFEDH